jgi:hypothetical protein
MADLALGTGCGMLCAVCTRRGGGGGGGGVSRLRLPVCVCGSRSQGDIAIR